MKKHLPKLALTLVLGALLNVAVTWGWAAATTFKSRASAELHTPLGNSYHWWVIRWDQVGGTRIMSRCWQDSAPEPFTDGDPGQLLARWGRIVPPDPDAPVIRSQIDEGWGFPARSFSCHIEVGATTTRRGILQSGRNRAGEEKCGRIFYLRARVDCLLPGGGVCQSVRHIAWGSVSSHDWMTG